MASLDETKQILETQDQRLPELDEAISIIPDSVEEFERKYDDSEDLIDELNVKLDNFSFFRNRQVSQAALALDLANQGRRPDELRELANKFDEAGLEYVGRERIGATFGETVQVLGGGDWTRFTHTFEDWMSHDEVDGFNNYVKVNAFRSPAVEAGISVSVKEADLFQDLYSKVVDENLGDVEYFDREDGRHSYEDSESTELYFGRLEIPSPFPEVHEEDTEYDREKAVEAVEKYRDTIQEMVEIKQSQNELKQEYRTKLEELVDKKSREL